MDDILLLMSDLEKHLTMMIKCCSMILCIFFMLVSMVTPTTIVGGNEYSVELMWNISERQSFIVDYWHIPDTWVNPSMVRDPVDPQKIVIIWRMLDNRKRDKIGYMWLDLNFTVIKHHDMIELFGMGGSRSNLVAEDARIFTFDGNLYVVYNIHLTKYKELYFGRLFYDANLDALYVNVTPRHVSIEHEFGQRHQKNWIPFEYDSSMLHTLESDLNSTASRSSVVPHRIVRAIPTEDYSEMIAHTIFLTTLEDDDNNWGWGEMRGGSQAFQIDNDHFLTFFHSSGHYNMKGILTYCMGAYLFESKPPFAITHVSPEPIVAKPFINDSLGWSYKSVDFVVFPMGFFFDNEYIYVSCGKNDNEGWAIKLNKTGLLESLRPVRSRLLGNSSWYPNGALIPHSFKHVARNHERVHGRPAAAGFRASAAAIESSIDETALAYPNGTVIRMEGDGGYWYMEDGQRRWIPNWDTFQALKCEASKVRVVDAQEFDRIVAGPVMPALDFPRKLWAMTALEYPRELLASRLGVSGALARSKLYIRDFFVGLFAG